MPKRYKNVRERNGKYSYRFDTIDAATGKRIQKETKQFATAREAENEGIKIKASLLQGTFIDKTDLSIGELADLWIELYEVTGIKENTIVIRKSAIKLIKSKIGGLRVQQIILPIYQKFLNGLKKEDYSKSTLLNVHAVMKMMLDLAIEMDLVKKNVSKSAKIPSYNKTVEELENAEEIPEFLEKEELKKLLDHALKSGDLQGYRSLYILSYTGIRVGELCALKDTDIDEVNNEISIKKTLYVPKSIKNFVLNTPKNKSSIRTVGVTRRVMQMIKEQLAYRAEFKMLHRKEYQYNGPNFLFFSEGRHKGYPKRIGEVEKFMSEILKSSKLPEDLTPHSLRHTFTSLMAEAGVDIDSIQAILGHVNDETTRAVYLHMTKARKQAATEMLDKLMNSVRG